LKEALEFSQRIRARLIFSSTSEIYGTSDRLPFKETDWGSVNPRGERSCYDESKRFGESLLFNFNKKHGSNHGLVRIFNTYGPGMHPNDGRVVINFLKAAAQGQDLQIYGDGLQTRSFCYITDLIGALVAYADSENTEPINIGNDEEISILNLAKMVQNLVLPQKLQIKFSASLVEDPRIRRPDLTLALKKLTPWQPRVSLHDGLLKTHRWMTEQVL